LAAPGMVLTLAERPSLSGLPAAAHVRRSDSSNIPLLGFGPPPRYVPLARPRPRDRRHLSWGFLPLQRIKKRESTSQPVARPGAPAMHRESADRSHSIGYGVARRFSQPLGDLLPPSTGPPFSGRWRSWGLPFRGLSSRAAPATRRRRHAFLTFFLSVALPPS
jgi:hypothetical protein